MSAFGKFIRGFDKYGVPIGVNFQGDDTHKSKVGGVVTFLTYCLVLAYTVMKMQQLATRTNPNVTSTTEFVNYSTDTTEYNLEENETEAVIRLEIMQEDGATWSFEHLDDRYGRFIAFQVAQTWPLPEERRRLQTGRRGRRLETISSIGVLYADTSEETSGEVIPEEDMLEIRDCDELHLWNLEEQVRDIALAQKNRKCVDMSNAKISGGTLDGNVEHIIVIEWQRCDQFAADKSTCYDAEQYNAFFADVIVTLEIADDYIKFSEPDTTKAVEGRLEPTLVVDSAKANQSHVKGTVTLSPNTADFMDTVYGVIPSFDLKEKDYLTVETVEQEGLIKSQDKDVFQFGATFILKRDARHYYQSRNVYTILDLLGDVGGFYGAIDLLVAPLLGIWAPTLFSLALLNSNFKYDDSRPDGGSSSSQQDKNKKNYEMNDDDSLRDRLTNDSNGRVELSPPDLSTLELSNSSVFKYRLDFCLAFMADQLRFLVKGNRRVKIYEKGKDSVTEHLDIVNLVKTSLDFKILKKLYLLPRQRALYEMQKKQAFSIDTSSGEEDDNAPEEDFERQHRSPMFDEMSEKCLSRADLKNNTDRRLLLGLMYRNNDMAPRVRNQGRSDATRAIHQRQYEEGDTHSAVNSMHKMSSMMEMSEMVHNKAQDYVPDPQFSNTRNSGPSNHYQHPPSPNLINAKSSQGPSRHKDKRAFVQDFQAPPRQKYSLK